MNNAFAQTDSDRHSVVLVEDQTAIRQMLATFIASVPGFHVVDEAGSVTEALASIARHRPAVVILDWMLPGGTGHDVLRALPAADRPHVLVCSANTSEQVVSAALAAGAMGIIEKTAGFAQFTEALRAVGAGQTYLGSAGATPLHRPFTPPPPTRISVRERDILRLIAEGHTSREIAAQLSLSLRTVENHRANIARRTGFRSVAQFTLLAARLGLIPTSAPVLA